MLTRVTPIVGLLLLATPAVAGLGQDASSVKQDAQNLGGEPIVSKHDHYTLNEIDRSWATVREFSREDGKVFALSWTGQRHPDLDTLLGEHLGEFQAGLQKARRQHRHGGALMVDTENLHVEMGGHMGTLFGKVWLKNQLPAGMDTHEVK